MLTNIGLVEHCKKMLGHPYWYATCCYKPTEDLLARKTKQYPSHYTSGRMAKYKQQIQDGAIVADCVGLI